MNIKIKTLKGDSFPLTVEDTETIASIKTRVAEQRADLPAARQKLIHAGKVLTDDQLVSGTNLKEGEFLVCMVSKESKPKPAPAAAAAPTPAPATASTTPAAAAASTPGAPAQSAAAPGASTPAPGPVSDSGPGTPAAVYDSPDAVAALAAMGFPESEVRAALNAAQGDGNIAVEFLMNGIPPQLAAAAAAGAGGAPTGGAPAGGAPAVSLDSLRQHPQFAQLRQVVRANPASVNNVLELIGQQSPELLEAIHADQAGFMDMMLNESDDPPPAPPAAGGAAGAPAVNPMAGGAGMPGMGGAPNAAQLAQVMGMMNSLPPAQQQAMLQQLGMTPEQWQQMSTMLQQVPPDQLDAMMQQGMGGMGGMGGAGAPQPQQIHLTEEEMAAVTQLQGLGFTQQEAVQAYIACDKNVEQAAAFLFSNQD